ncbi:hypothetical protein E2553_01950 [Paraburkholderia dipogonis]|uniref:Uncharacterized protein n=1 Tax=Paraburkholderia dipogonis TaxID=1211383 RepID=A0A4Y8N294_9BURK|nr:hypothetical protein [Paraburkholderia dipogonis]TFE43900.1 hypothetical protein E2553_01950 [Paraburkholderia dipogonis]
MPKTSASTAFGIFERVVVSLYDGGVLSPAVLERVIGAFAQADADWQGNPRVRSVDGRSLHEIVVRTMLPGDDLQSASISFMTVIEHIAQVAHSAGAASETAKEAEPRRARSRKTAGADEDEVEDANADELLAQLSGSTQSGKRRRSNKNDRPAGSGTFNPFLNAALPRTKKS